jgi:ubiquinone/menaquinone biosynthesis C-methylase UbiE
LVSLVFGSQLRLAQQHFITELDDPDSILIFGGGTGSILRPLQSHYPKAHILYLESSEQMIAMARKRFAGKQHNIKFVRGDEKYLERPHSEEFDAILTPFVLDIFEVQHIRHVISALSGLLKQGGWWIQTDFYLDHHSPDWQHLMVRIMYWFFRWTTGLRNKKLPDFDGLFQRPELRTKGQARFYRNMVKTVLFEKIKT